MTTEKKPLSIFVSSTRKDLKLTREVAKRLQAAGFTPFLDSVDLPPGTAWKPEIGNHLRDAAGVVLLLTPAALDSPWMMRELGMAEAFDKPVLPVLAGLPVERLPEPLQSYQTLLLEQLDEAIARLKHELAGAEG